MSLFPCELENWVIHDVSVSLVSVEVLISATINSNVNILSQDTSKVNFS